MKLSIYLLCLLCTFALSASASETTITYQGQLQQAGTPFTGTTDLEFRLFDQPSDGSQVGTTQTRDNWPVEDGLFQVELDFGAAAFSQQVRYLEIRVGGSALNPRQAVRASPMALFALTSGDSSWDQVPGGIEYDDGGVRIGSNSFGSGRLRVDAGGHLDGVHATTSNPGGYAVYGVANAGGGAGVYGRASDGTTYGVGGSNSSTSGTGVFGRASAATGTTYGVQGVTHSPNGFGVFGRASATSGPSGGVWGENASTNGSGVAGWATATSGTNYGVAGRNDSPEGRGVFGIATATSGFSFGVRGESASTQGRGVFGLATATSGQNYGVRGQTQSSGGFAAYFSGVAGSRNYFQRSVGIGTSSPGAMLDVVGNANVSGTLSKGGGSFKIDHPLDPKNQYLFHSFVESPDMMNVYNGNVVTDRTGHAVVELPVYFEALNTDFRYQLTVIGTFAQAIVAEEIADNRFLIATDQPEVKVSWQVTGIRNDAWARANRIGVEVPKLEQERGQYLHPEAFGVEVPVQEDSAYHEISHE
jgi:hypothetical protein